MRKMNRRTKSVLPFLAVFFLMPGACFAEESEAAEAKENFISYADNGIAGLIEEPLAEMEKVSKEEDGRWVLLRFFDGDMQDSILRSFSIYDPSVFAEETDADLVDLTATANWAVYDAYRFWLEEDAAEPICREAMTQFFGEEWQELKSFSFAAGCLKTEEGTYYWTPVYYEAEDGSIYEDNIYLFVYLLREGADQEALDGQMYYAAYGTYRREMLVIAEPERVADFLKLLRLQVDALEITEDTAEYTMLSLDSSGEAVRAIQEALAEQGFLTSSVDGYYGPLTQEAVAAYQEAAGLEATGEADAELQRKLLSTVLEKGLLLNWLEMYE